MNPPVRSYFHGTSACLSALYRAERYGERVELLKDEAFWPYKRWAVKAMGAMGQKDEAIRMAEASRDRRTDDADVDELCEELLLASGRVDEAYKRYGLEANRCGTYLTTFRAIAKKYPQKPPEEILADLVAATPREEAKWFATAKDLGLYKTAIALVATSPCDPKTLARATRDFATWEPEFAVDAGYSALHWVAEGYGYEISHADVRMAYASAMKATEALGRGPDTKERIRALAQGHNSGLLADALGFELGLRR